MTNRSYNPRDPNLPTPRLHAGMVRRELGLKPGKFDEFIAKIDAELTRQEDAERAKLRPICDITTGCRLKGKGCCHTGCSLTARKPDPVLAGPPAKGDFGRIIR